MLNNSNEEKRRHYFIAQDQENKKNIQDIYYFKLDDDRFYPYKEIDSLYGVFKKLEGPGLTFNELYIQEFFKRVEYWLRMEVSKNHTNQINQEKSKEASSPTMNPPQNPQTEPNTNKARSIHDIFQAHYSFASYASEEGVVELSAEEICKINQYTEDIRKGSNEELNKFIKKIEEVRTMLMIALDNLDPEIFKKYVSEGKVEVLKKYLHVVKQYFEITADILNECDALDDGDKFQSEGVVAKKLKRIEKILNQNTQNLHGQPTNGDAESETQYESEQPQQKAQFADKTPEQGLNNGLNLQTTHNEPQAKSDPSYNNTGMYCALGVAALGFMLIGVILCATVNPIAGGIVIAATVVSLLGVVAMETYARKKENPEMNTLTALKEVLTPKWLNDNNVAIEA